MKLNSIFAQFDNVDSLLAAARKVRDAGYTKWDVHTPFPVHGLDAAMGVKPTILPWLIFGAGASGMLGGFLLTWWTNAIDYKYVVSGKPFLSLPANVPVIFECTILFAAFTAFFGMLVLNGLPSHYQPLLRREKFRSVTSDRFVIAIDGQDPLFDPVRTKALLGTLGAGTVEEVPEPDEPMEPPFILRTVGVIAAILALVPPLLIVKARYGSSESTKIHILTDMDFQPKKKSQTTSPLFEDGRASRLPVPGTVARGMLRDDSAYFQGKNADGSYVAKAPVAATPQLLARGKERYEISCMPCHGLAGDGDGLVARRAVELKESAWVPPSSLHMATVVAQPDGQLFESITKGVRSMPAYGPAVTPEDRWAIILYVRALEKSRLATIDDVPAEKRGELH